MDRDQKIIADHLPLEEVMIADIDGINSPENWSRTTGDETPELPPVIIEENRGFSLVGNHRTVWHLKNSGRTMVKCLIVRSTVHVRPAHSLISNCTEEAMLFEGLLRREIVSNRSRLADMLGYSRARITQLLNLLKLPVDIRQKVLLTDEISEFQLRQLLKVLDDEQKLQTGFKRLLEKKLSGRQMALFAKSKQIEGDDSDTESDTEADNNADSNSTTDKDVYRELSSNAVKTDVPSLEIVLDDPGGSIAELEGVFSGDEILVTEKLPPDESTETKTPVKEPSRVNMAEILREIGSLRDHSWKMRAAEYMLSEQQLEFLEGVSKMRTGLYTEAIDILGEIVSEDSSHHLAWFYLGRCSNLTGSLQGAEEYLRNAISRSPDNPDYIVELAIVLEKLKRHSEAEAFYKKSAVIRKKMATGK